MGRNLPRTSGGLCWFALLFQHGLPALLRRGLRQSATLAGRNSAAISPSQPRLGHILRRVVRTLRRDYVIRRLAAAGRSAARSSGKARTYYAAAPVELRCGRFPYASPRQR